MRRDGVGHKKPESAAHSNRVDVRDGGRHGGRRGRFKMEGKSTGLSRNLVSPVSTANQLTAKSSRTV